MKKTNLCIAFRYRREKSGYSAVRNVQKASKKEITIAMVAPGKGVDTKKDSNKSHHLFCH